MCFCIFGENLKNQNGRHFWGEENILKITKTTYCLDNLWVENFDEITLSRTVTEIEANLCFCIFLPKFGHNKAKTQDQLFYDPNLNHKVGGGGGVEI